jgi:hypothetical protein
MRAIALIAIGVLFVPPPDLREKLFADASTIPPSSLFRQSAARKLEREFAPCVESAEPTSDKCRQLSYVSFLLLDAHTGAVLASRWPNPEVPIPLGSLVKPITALAYGQRHQFRYPTHICRGTKSGCWLPRGHGKVELTTAIEYSCNSYFRTLTAEMTSADITPLARSLGLRVPEPGASGIALAGIGVDWQNSPLRMAAAYLELVRRREQPGIREIVVGMEQSAEQGTGAEVDRALGRADALVKTGTAPCTHPRRTPGDGFVIALMPATDPQILLMVRVHGVPGTQAARTAGMMLRRIEE